jgi:hypothetical protein
MSIGAGVGSSVGSGMAVAVGWGTSVGTSSDSGAAQTLTSKTTASKTYRKVFPFIYSPCTKVLLNICTYYDEQSTFCQFKGRLIFYKTFAKLRGFLCFVSLVCGNAPRKDPFPLQLQGSGGGHESAAKIRLI